MAYSTILLDYLGRGTHADRPVSPPIASNALAFYHEDDTGSTFVWTGSAWSDVTGAVDLSALLDVDITTPANGDVLTWNSTAGKWENAAPSGGGVASLNSLAGALSLVAGSNVTITPSGSNITIAASTGSSYPAAGYDAVVAADSPTHYYKGNDLHTASSIADSVGSINLTMNGLCRAGERALVQDGSGSVFIPARSNGSDYLSFVANAFYPFVNVNFSIELWFMLASVAYNGVTCIYDSDSGDRLLFGLGAGFDTSQFQIWATNHSPTTALHFPPGVPVHFVYTWDGTNSTFYANGNQIYQTATSPNPGSITSGTGYLGGRHDLSGAVQAPMYLHKMAGYSGTALTAAQVLSHYAAGVPLL